MNSDKNALTSSTTVTPPSYQPQMDGLRAIAILFVLVHHFHGPFHSLFNSGTLGVRFFFVLSAFLVTRSFLKSRAKCVAGKSTPLKEFRQFEMRRLIRIVPPYYLFLLIAGLLAIAPVRETLAWTLPFLTNFYMAWLNDFPATISHFWYLAVQEQIYLFWPWLIFFLPTSSLKYVFSGLIAATLAFRLYCIFSGASDIVRWFNPLGSLDSFAIGGILACVSLTNPVLLYKKSTRLWTGVIALLAVVGGNYLRLLPLQNPWSIGSEFLEAVCMGWIIACSVMGFRGWLGSFLSWKPIVYMGKISYGIYVYHVLVSILLDSAFVKMNLAAQINPDTRFFILSAISVLVASLSWHFFETPILQVRDHLADRLKKKTKAV